MPVAVAPLLRSAVAVALSFLASGGVQANELHASPDVIRAHVSFLADDAVEGRLPGTRGYDVAARYVASSFMQSGLEPGAANGEWLQPVALVESLALLPPATLVLHPSTGAPLALAPGKDFLPTASLTDAKTVARAPLVFAGFGVHAPSQGHDDLAGIDVKGKVVVLFSGAPSRFPPAVRAHYSSGLTKLPMLIERGAVGVITLQ